MTLTAEDREKGKQALIYRNQLRDEGKVPGKAVIPVDAQYRIEMDAFSWQVSRFESIKSRPGDGSWKGLTWHMTLRHAVESLTRRMVAQESLKGAEEVCRALEASTQVIAEAIAKAGVPDHWTDAKAHQLDGHEVKQ